MIMKKYATLLTAALIITAFFIVVVPQTEAASKRVSITFTTSGYSTCTSNVIYTIDGANYYDSNLPLTFSWKVGGTHTVKAASSLTGSDSAIYTFIGWTNGNGLTTASGTFTVPSSGTSVTAKYAKSTVRVTFDTSGLSNLNLDTVLTIDGKTYNYREVDCTNFQWTIGSTHTVTAASSITGWDHVTHYFSSWTCGNGLTTNSGTFTTPSCDTSVTVNYALKQDTNPAATTLTVTCSNSANPNAVTLSGTLTSGSTGLNCKTITLSYYNGATWVAIGQATTNSNGAYSYTWTVPTELTSGIYPLKASFGGDSCYQASNANTELTFDGVQLQVLPEAWGSIVALFACFAGAIVFVKLRRNTATKPNHLAPAFFSF
jgi:hypothetical protein